MIVCVCRRVSDRDIARAVREGCASFDELQSTLGVATACGACRGCAEQTFETQTALCACSGASAAATAAPPQAIAPLRVLRAA